VERLQKVKLQVTSAVSELYWKFLTTKETLRCVLRKGKTIAFLRFADLPAVVHLFTHLR